VALMDIVVVAATAIYQPDTGSVWSPPAAGSLPGRILDSRRLQPRACHPLGRFLRLELEES